MLAYASSMHILSNATGRKFFDMIIFNLFIGRTNIPDPDPPIYLFDNRLKIHKNHHSFQLPMSKNRNIKIYADKKYAAKFIKYSSSSKKLQQIPMGLNFLIKIVQPLQKYCLILMT